MRRMYDGVTASRLPLDGDLYGGYVDGYYRWSTADWDRFRGKRLVRIAALPTTNDGQVWDCEQGNGTPEQAPDWVLMRRRAGVDPSIYIQQSWWTRLVIAFHDRGVALPHIWVANWDGVAQLPAGAVAKQYASNDAYDTSVVADYWPGVDPVPAAPPPPKPPAPPPPPPKPPAPPPPPPYDYALEDDMIMVSVSGTPGPDVYLVSGPMISHIAAHSTLDSFTAQGVKTATVDQTSFNNMVAAAAALKGALSGSLGVSGTLTVS